MRASEAGCAGLAGPIGEPHVRHSCLRRPHHYEVPTPASDPTAPAAADDLASFRRAIEQINREAPEAFRRQDPAALAAWFAPDARLYVHGMAVIEGRAAIAQFYAGTAGPPMHLRDASFTLLELAVGNGWGFETGANTLTLQPPGAPDPILVPGKYLAVWQRQPDGRWLLWRHAPSSDLAPGAS